MVAPLRQVNKLLGNTPIVGNLLGGSVISVPVKVTGTPAEPQVTYLPPSAVASSLSGMMKRTMNLPVSILSPLFPKEKRNKRLAARLFVLRIIRTLLSGFHLLEYDLQKTSR